MIRIPIDSNGRQYVPDQWTEIPGEIRLQQVRLREEPELLAVYYRGNSPERQNENALIVKAYIGLVLGPTKRALKEGSLRHRTVDIEGVTPKREEHEDTVIGLLEWCTFLTGFFHAKVETMRKAEAEIVARETLRLFWTNRSVDYLRNEAARFRKEIVLPGGLSRESALEVLLEELSDMSYKAVVETLRRLYPY